MFRVKICLVSPPYSGHLNPLLAMGRALSKIAEVTVISTPGAMAAVTASGLNGQAILGSHEALVNEIAAPGKPVKGNPLRLLRQLRANVSLQEEMRRALDGAFLKLKPDLVIADFTLPVAGPAAAACGATWWTSTPSPCVFETPDGPPAYFGGLGPARSKAGKFRAEVLRRLTRFFKRLVFFGFRKSFRAVGLESVYRGDGAERIYSPEVILGCGIRELEFSRRWPDHFHFVGPSLYTPALSRSSPVFVEGKKQVLVTLGTHLNHHKNEIAEWVKSVARERSDWVFHFSDGKTGGPDAGGEGNFHRHGFISYDEFLGRYDAVVHHGGSGILLHCLRLGIPAVVIPLDFDQFDNAARLVAGGLARQVKKARALGPALEEVLENPSIADECRKMAEVIDGYHSGPAVCRLVEVWLRSR